ncbi:MAG: amino acid ABC transporter permease [Ruminococcaceae bacterium]|nr:amino acid ABC transporter permease [Oscillospiraceae bacterium]
MSFIDVNIQLLEGFRVTLLIFFATLAAAIPLGLVITFGSMSRFAPLRYLTRTFVWIIRGTPLMLQVMIVFFGPGLLFSLPPLPRLGAVLIAFIINYACYFSEIYRGGIESIPKGQYEAGQVLGMTKAQVFFRVVLFQVIKRIVPAMGNEVITLVKDTSLARVISVVELVKAAQDIVGLKSIIWPLFYIGAFYLVFSGILTVFFSKLEKKLNYYQG